MFCPDYSDSWTCRDGCGEGMTGNDRREYLSHERCSLNTRPGHQHSRTHDPCEFALVCVVYTTLILSSVASPTDRDLIDGLPKKAGTPNLECIRVEFLHQMFGGGR